MIFGKLTLFPLVKDWNPTRDNKRMKIKQTSHHSDRKYCTHQCMASDKREWKVTNIVNKWERLRLDEEHLSMLDKRPMDGMGRRNNILKLRWWVKEKDRERERKRAKFGVKIISKAILTMDWTISRAMVHSCSTYFWIESNTKTNKTKNSVK